MSGWQIRFRHIDRAGAERACRPRDLAATPHKTERTMRFMVIVKASKDTEAGVMPSTELLTAMGKFNEEMVKAGVMEAGEGLHPSSRGARIRYSGAQKAVSRGPFDLTNDLVAGFWLIQTKSLDEAIDWMK